MVMKRQAVLWMVVILVLALAGAAPEVQARPGPR
jgi:hypothetical protein